MATYQELHALATNDVLRTKIRVGCIVAAETIRTEAEDTPGHAARLAWARAVFANPAVESERMTWAVLAANRAATPEQITGATDATIQAKVDAAVALFAAD